jgi:hypothetical protein
VAGFAIRPVDSLIAIDLPFFTKALELIDSIVDLRLIHGVDTSADSVTKGYDVRFWFRLNDALR